MCAQVCEPKLCSQGRSMGAVGKEGTAGPAEQPPKPTAGPALAGESHFTTTLVLGCGACWQMGQKGRLSDFYLFFCMYNCFPLTIILKRNNQWKTDEGPSRGPSWLYPERPCSTAYTAGIQSRSLRRSRNRDLQ